MKMAFKIVFFAFMLNIASGLIIFALPDLPSQYSSYINPIAEQTQGQNSLIEGLGGNVTLPSTTASSSNVKDVLFDSLIIGKIQKIGNGIKTMLFGFPEIMYNSLLLFASETADIAFLQYVKNTLNIIMGLCYVIGMVGLWTGKNITN